MPGNKKDIVILVPTSSPSSTNLEYPDGYAPFHISIQTYLRTAPQSIGNAALCTSLTETITSIWDTDKELFAKEKTSKKYFSIFKTDSTRNFLFNTIFEIINKNYQNIEKRITELPNTQSIQAIGILDDVKNLVIFMTRIIESFTANELLLNLISAYQQYTQFLKVTANLLDQGLITLNTILEKEPFFKHYKRIKKIHTGMFLQVPVLSNIINILMKHQEVLTASDISNVQTIFSDSQKWPLYSAQFYFRLGKDKKAHDALSNPQVIQSAKDALLQSIYSDNTRTIYFQIQQILKEIAYYTVIGSTFTETKLEQKQPSDWPETWTQTSLQAEMNKSILALLKIKAETNLSVPATQSTIINAAQLLKIQAQNKIGNEDRPILAMSSTICNRIRMIIRTNTLLSALADALLEAYDTSLKVMLSNTTAKKTDTKANKKSDDETIQSKNSVSVADSAALCVPLSTNSIVGTQTQVSREPEVSDTVNETTPEAAPTPASDPAPVPVPELTPEPAPAPEPEPEPEPTQTVPALADTMQISISAPDLGPQPEPVVTTHAPTPLLYQAPSATQNNAHLRYPQTAYLQAPHHNTMETAYHGYYPSYYPAAYIPTGQPVYWGRTPIYPVPAPPPSSYRARRYGY